MLRKLPSDDFAKTLNKFTDQKERLKKELRAFLAYKDDNPANGFVPGVSTGYGDSDRKFKPGGNFTSKIRDISHAHLTHNISIVYLIQGDVIYLYGVYTHDDIGTGSPENVNRQQQMATRWSNMQFSQELDANTLAPKTSSTTTEPTKKAGSNISYAPKAKQPAQQSVATAAPSQVERLAQQADSLWPQRQLYEKLKNSPNTQTSVNIISQEAHYIKSLKQQGKRLFPNQLEYMETLEKIAIVLSNKKKP